MNILNAEFVTSVGPQSSFPTDDRQIIALIGRSNVGKSTLVNTLVKKKIAHAGGTPGTTRLLNVYHVRVSTGSAGTLRLLIVDLPGYGYARGGKNSRLTFDTLTRNFFTALTSEDATARRRRYQPRLAGVILALDIRHPGLASDLAALAWARSYEIPVVAVVTKTDRLPRAALRKAISDHEMAIEGPVIVVSGKTGSGTDALWRVLIDLL